MRTDCEEQPWLAGVDGCRNGWIVVFCRVGRRKDAIVEVKAHFADIVTDPRAPAVIAVDMPIGLPDFSASGGRRPEREVRRRLGQRRSSVFSTPSRRAVYAYEQGYDKVCAIARQTADPDRPWAPSKQAFHIFPHIIQIDRALGEHPDAVQRVYEVHPELSFALMNGAPLSEPKKRRGRLHPPGLAMRRALLLKEGFSAEFLDGPLPHSAGLPKAGRDDFYDACAALWSAARIHAGCAEIFPAAPERDAYGLPMAIRG